VTADRDHTDHDEERLPRSSRLPGTAVVSRHLQAVHTDRLGQERSDLDGRRRGGVPGRRARSGISGSVAGAD